LVIFLLGQWIRCHHFGGDLGFSWSEGSWFDGHENFCWRRFVTYICLSIPWCLLNDKYMLKLFCNFNRLFIFLTIFDHYAYLLSCDCMQTLILDLLDVWGVILLKEVEMLPQCLSRYSNTVSYWPTFFTYAISKHYKYPYTIMLATNINMTLIRVSVEIISMWDLSSLHLMLLSCLRRNMLMWSYQEGEITLLQLI
jgi:hypothetical protein